MNKKIQKELLGWKKYLNVFELFTIDDIVPIIAFLNIKNNNRLQ